MSEITEKTEATSSETPEEDVKGHRYAWLLNSTVLVALIGFFGIAITNIQTISDTYTSWTSGVDAEKVDLAKKRQAFMRKAIQNNYECINSAEMYHKNPSNIEIDATLCKETGDIFLRLNSPVYGRGISVVFIEDHLSKVSGDGTESAGLGFGVRAAHASVLPNDRYDDLSDTASPSVSPQYAQSFVITICQRIESDGQTMLRHVKVDGQCHDEFWDTFSGKLKNSVQVPCRTSC